MIQKEATYLDSERFRQLMDDEELVLTREGILPREEAEEKLIMSNAIKTGIFIEDEKKAEYLQRHLHALLEFAIAACRRPTVQAKKTSEEMVQLQMQTRFNIAKIEIGGLINRGNIRSILSLEDLVKDIRGGFNKKFSFSSLSSLNQK